MVHAQLRQWSQIANESRQGGGVTKQAAKARRVIGTLRLLLMRVVRNPQTQELGVQESYVESRTGRLYGVGLTLQNVPKELRKALFTTYTEWDFEACHAAIVAGYARKVGMPLQTLEFFAHSKAAIRRKMAEQLGLKISDVKTALTTLIYGASISGEASTALVDLLGQEKLSVLKTDPIFREMADELQSIRPVMICNHSERSSRGSVIRNALGKDVREADLRNGGPSAMAHIVQGYEAYILDSLIRCLADHDGITREVCLIQHDGFTSRSSVLERLGSAIDAIEADSRIGWRMELSHEVLHWHYPKT